MTKRLDALFYEDGPKGLNGIKTIMKIVNKNTKKTILDQADVSKVFCKGIFRKK